MEWFGFGAALIAAVVAAGSYQAATARLGRVERKLNLLLRHAGIEPGLGPLLSERVQALARDSARKIAAIKAYREETGAGLAETTVGGRPASVHRPPKPTRVAPSGVDFGAPLSAAAEGGQPDSPLDASEGIFM